MDRTAVKSLSLSFSPHLEDILSHTVVDFSAVADVVDSVLQTSRTRSTLLLRGTGQFPGAPTPARVLWKLKNQPGDENPDKNEEKDL